MKIRLISFTDRGEELARRLGELLPGESMRCNCPLPLGEWCARALQGSPDPHGDPRATVRPL